MASAKQPVFIQLFGCYNDHLNIEITEENLERILTLIGEERKAHPEAAPCALLQFTGAMSEALEGRNPANRVLDRIKEAAGAGLVEAGYEGAEEPTWRTRPRPNLRSASNGIERWLARSEPAGWFLADYKHFLTGLPDAKRSGGLKRAVEVFGRLTFISGYSEELGGDSEFVHHIRRYSRDAVLPGLPEPQTWPARDLPGYRGETEGIGQLMSPEPEFAPEIFWQDNFLRLSDTSGPAVAVVSAHEGPETLKNMLEQLDRSRIHVIRVRLASHSIHLKPEFEKTLVSSTVRYSYDNPKPARLPEDAFRPRSEIEAAFGREKALIRWLEEEFFPANPGSRFVCPGTLKEMAGEGAPFPVSAGKLTRAANDLIERWNETGNHPPSYAVAEGKYFSLADMLSLLANALSDVHRKGSVASSVRLDPVYGPLDFTDDQGPPVGVVQRASLARAAAELSERLSRCEGNPVPGNVIPGRITVDGMQLNSAQFLRLMAESLIAPANVTVLKVRTCQMFSPAGEMFPKTRLREDAGSVWTLKPARLQPSP